MRTYCIAQGTLLSSLWWRRWEGNLQKSGFMYMYSWFPLHEHIVRNTGLDELWAGIKTGRRNINSLRYADDTIRMAESQEELKSLLMRVKKESERAGLRLNIRKTKIMASGPITAWQIEEEKVEVVTDFLFLGSRITADGDCNHEIGRQLPLGRKAMTNLDSVLKNWGINLPTMVWKVKAMVFNSGHLWLRELDCKEGRMPKN